MRIQFGLVFAAVAGTYAQLTSRTGLGDDVCGDVSGFLEVPSKLLFGKIIKVGFIDKCLCLSGVSQFVLTDPFAIAGISLAGRQAVIDAVTKMVNKAPDHKTCKYPAHAAPLCKKGNPCFFTCKDGFEASPASKPTKCVCPKGTSECNGKCIKGLCPSGHGHGKRDVSIMGRELRCSPGLTACGVLGRSAHAWDCVDIARDLESCGGCAIPLFPDDPFATGVDCTALPGVADVACVKGVCVVRRCMPGYEGSSDGTTCVHRYDTEGRVVMTNQPGAM
ncbi:hypothetical protein ONZ45_g18099 [Pleurotus djamor]|nr:hypothetical protein ONZ45_g18099 [Pleurotus djamor]